MNHKRTKFIAILIGAVFLVAVFLFSGCAITKEQKYKDCMNECEESKTCLEYSNREGNSFIEDRMCVKWSKGECQNICISKYK